MKQTRKSVRTWRTPIAKIVTGILNDSYSETFARTYAGYLLNAVNLIDEKVGKAEIRKPNTRTVQKTATQHAVNIVKQAHPDWTVREVAYACGVSAATVSRYTR